MSSPSATERHLDAGRRALSLGDHDGAEREFLQAIVQADAPGGDSGQLATALAAYGQMLYQSKRFGEAISPLRRALATREAMLGGDDLPLVPSLYNLAAVHLAAGEAPAAEPLLRRTLDILEHAHGPDHPEVAPVLNGLSQLYLKQGAWARAEPLLVRLLAMRRAEGEERPEVATVMASLATVYHALAEHDAAEQLLRRVLAIRERTLAPNHFAIATTLEALAETCATRGKLDEALALLERALEMRERTLGAGHPSLAVVRAKIADLQLQNSQDAFAVPLLEALEPRRTTWPDAEPPRRMAYDAEVHRETSSPEPSTAVRQLAAELQGSPGSQPVARGDEGSLAISILPTGSALALPGVTRAPLTRFDYDENLDQSLEDEDTLDATPVSRWSRIGGRKLASAGALAAVAVAAVVGVHAAGGGDTAAADAAATVERPMMPTSALATIPVGGAIDALSRADSAALRAGNGSARSVVSANGSTSPADSPERQRNASESRSVAPTSSSAPSPIGTSRPGAPSAPVVGNPALPSLDIRVNPSVPLLDLSAPAASDPSLLGAGSPRVTPARAAYPVDRGLRLPALIGELPTPRYPPSLKRDGIAGEVVVAFAVDTLGRVERESFRVVRASDPRFVGPVSAVMGQLRFVPAEREGRNIRHTVEMAFKFEP